MEGKLVKQEGTESEINIDKWELEGLVYIQEVLPDRNYEMWESHK